MQTPSQLVNTQGSMAFETNPTHSFEVPVDLGSQLPYAGVGALIGAPWVIHDVAIAPVNVAKNTWGIGGCVHCNTIRGCGEFGLHNQPLYPTTPDVTPFQTVDDGSSYVAGANAGPPGSTPSDSTPVQNHNHLPTAAHPCNRCDKAFKRAGDLRRHYKVHFPDQRTFQCHYSGCDRNGANGFYRRDKYREHLRKAHNQ